MEKNDKIFVFGHKNPDTDSICSSVVMANLRSKLGENVEAVRLGELNKETEFAFKRFDIEPPRLIDKLEDGSNVILVDHNEFAQSAEGIENANIKMLVDHHRVADFKTSEPVYMFSEPVGCTGTILYKLYNMNGVEIDSKMASLMLSSIASDTLLFKSPTCTPDDIRAAEALEKIANVDINSFLKEIDVLIADYSSVYSDYILMNKPVVAFHYDYEEYMSGTRSSYFDFDDYMPEEKAFTMEELQVSILKVLDLKDFSKIRSETIHNMFGDIKTNVSELLCRKIVELLKKGD